MDENRSYLSVSIPIHEYFRAKPSKGSDYSKRIMGVLGAKQLSLTELAKAMGYKGIAAKLSSAVKDLFRLYRIYGKGDNGRGNGEVRVSQDL